MDKKIKWNGARVLQGLNHKKNFHRIKAIC